MASERWGAVEDGFGFKLEQLQVRGRQLLGLLFDYLFHICGGSHIVEAEGLEMKPQYLVFDKQVVEDDPHLVVVDGGLGALQQQLALDASFAQDGAVQKEGLIVGEGVVGEMVQLLFVHFV